MATIYSLGVGPGNLELMSEQARAILERVDAVLGYSRIIHHLKPLLEGKAVYSGGHLKEKELVKEAFELAAGGTDVAVISRGESAMFGLAVLLQQQLGKYPGVTLEIVPGIPEFIAANALVGTTLSEGFSVLSLSTRLTAEVTILFRIRLIAQADLTTVLYYPADESSSVLLNKVIEIFAEHRPPDTPVAVVKQPFRKDQEVIVTSLESIDPENFSEYCLIYICSESSVIIDGQIHGKRDYII
jgi:precorrin-3B C17-methyltransferase